MAALELEVETYNRELATLLSTDPGKYVLIKETKVIDTFDSYEDALKCGYGKFGRQEFFVKQIAPPEQIAFFTRDLGGCLALP